MSSYHADQERAVRLLHRVRDWRESGLVTGAQHDRMAADLETGLRRTNIFLRGTLFVFGLMIAMAATGLVGVLLEPGNSTVWILAAVAAVASFAAAAFLINTYRVYRFGIEEAFAVAGILFAGVAVGLLFEPSLVDDTAFALGFMAAAVGAFVVFFQFGFVYAAVIGMACAALAPFQLVESDIARRLIAAAILAALFLAARLQRGDDIDEFPADNYAVVETAAWGGIYLVLNLKASAWLSHTEESGWFYWATYVAIWMLPAAGLWIAIRDRHRWMLDLNILMAIATLMSNKAYLGAERYAWDPIVFGLSMIAVAVGLRRWLAGGEGGSRAGFVPVRLLASERERLAAAGTVSVLQPPLHPQHPAAPTGPAVGGGGRSGGAGAGGSF
jgi:hypothetical protein